MSLEILEIIKQMNPKALETQFILQCAPVIAGLKVSNLLIIYKENVRYIAELLKDSDITWEFLAFHGKKVTILVYRKVLLEKSLANEETEALLSDMGYDGKSLDEILSVLKRKYQRYLSCREAFPHELGLVLGYPVEDVRGYMVDLGRNALHTGYWQVYVNPRAKIRIFGKYERAKEKLIRLVSDGVDLAQILSDSEEYLREYNTV